MKEDKRKHFRIDFGVSDEVNVREVFAMFHRELGYRIIESRARFPDYILENEHGREIRAEVEFKASNFQRHGHPVEECDLIICWYNDWPGCPIEVLELCRFVEQPCYDVNFSREELTELPNMIKRIKELTEKYEDILGRLELIVCDIDEFIRRNDHQTTTTKGKLGISCGRGTWCGHLVYLRINPEEGIIEIRGCLDSDIINTRNREELRQIIDRAKNVGFLLGCYENYRLRPLELEELLARATKGETVFIFCLHELVEIAEKPSAEIVKMLGNEVLRLLEFMDSERLVKMRDEE